MDTVYDLAVVGGGPGGYVAAVRGAQLKKNVLLVEKSNLGGTCMNWGCIPTKYLLQQVKILKALKENPNLEGPLDRIALDWHRVQSEKREIVEKLVSGIDFLLTKNGVTTVRGTGRLLGSGSLEVRQDQKMTEFSAEKIILATGSRPLQLPFIPDAPGKILSSRDALELDRVPASLVIIGAGAIGLEMGTIFSRMGTDVSILEILPNILPGTERPLALRLERFLKEGGLNIQTRMKIEACSVRENHVLVEGVSLKTDRPFAITAERILIAAGRTPNSENLVEQVPEDWTDGRGFIRVNDRFETKIPSVYAVGDVIGGPLLAHKASHEGIAAAENAAGMEGSGAPPPVPSAVFTDPELASVGLSEQEAREQGREIRVGQFPLQASSRAATLGQSQGLVKVVADGQEKIIGAQIIAPNASELIAELTSAIRSGLTLRDIGTCIHIHPTLSESVMEAALHARGEAIHILNL